MQLHATVNWRLPGLQRLFLSVMFMYVSVCLALLLKPHPSITSVMQDWKTIEFV